MSDVTDLNFVRSWLFELMGDPKCTRFCKASYGAYIVVQQNTTVSLTGLPVLRTLYKPMSMNKSTNSQNCEFCVL